MIYNGLELGSFFEIPWTSPCYQVLRGINPILQMVFTFSQMYFVFMNARVSNIWICQKFCTKKTMFIVHILLLCIMNCCLCQIKTLKCFIIPSILSWNSNELNDKIAFSSLHYIWKYILFLTISAQHP